MKITSPSFFACTISFTLKVAVLIALTVTAAGRNQASRARSWRSVRRRDRSANAITDVKGVEVGNTTLIEGAAGPLKVGSGRCGQG